jgi:hypothetical protein
MPFNRTGGPFNRLSPEQVERLAVLGEELAEAGLAIGKILRHGYASRHPDREDTSNRSDLEMEMGHVVAALSLLYRGGDLDPVMVVRAEDAKLRKLPTYLHEQSTVLLDWLRGGAK